MRFDDSFQEEDAPVRPKSIVPSFDRTSRTIRIKLLMLFAMLVMVVVLMKEAGKPERWEWMGFVAPKSVEIDIDASSEQGDSDENASEQSSASFLPENPGSSTNSRADAPDQPSRPITISANQSGSASGENLTAPVVSFDLPTVQPEYPVAAVVFWHSTFRRLNSDQQSTLLRLLKSIRVGQVIPQDQRPATQQLARQIRHHREQFHQSLFDKLALAADGTAEKTQLAEEMYESQEIWDKKIWPAIDAASRGTDFTMGQQLAVLCLQEVLDPLLYRQVQDRTSLGWAGDSAAWIRIWEKITSDETPKGDPVTRIELMGQPTLYRGRPVTVEGWVRSARKKILGPESKLGLSHYYILWVRPRETKLGPFCVYSMKIPEGFPPVTESFGDVNESVRVSGYSFKIRNYIAVDSSVAECPVIIAPNLERMKITEFTSVNRWQPSRSTLTIAFILIPLIATGLAWMAFRTSKTRQFVPGKKSQKKIDQSLSDLANNPLVQTEHEQVMSLYETDPHDQ